MTFRRLATAAALALCAASPAFAQSDGTIKPDAAAQGDAPQRPTYLPAAASGLQVFYRNYGKLALSVSAHGRSSPGAEAQVGLNVSKPSKDAKVLKAYLMSATSNFAVIPNGAMKLDKSAVTWMATVRNGPPGASTFFQSTLADVTDIIQQKVDEAGVGLVKVTVTEPSLSPSFDLIDGVTLVVVFKDPKAEKKSTIALLFGAQKPTGDRFEISLAKPIDRKKKDARAEMGLGISYSLQPANPGSPAQYTTIKVNGATLTSAAGGQDDGETGGGGLFTVGGLSDKPTNPSKPKALPKDSRDDDERYSLLSFLTKSMTDITVETYNPSGDDNVFFAWFDLGAEATVDIDDDTDTDGDGLLDKWEVSGLDADGDGDVDVDLPKLGANPLKKDIFIAYAWMQARAGETASHQPTQAQLDAVSEAFARAPVSNPDGTQGITIHWKNLGGVPHDDDLNPTWAEFDAIMDPKVPLRERKVWRRMLNAHGYDGGTSSGIARGIPASDFIESLGRFSTNPGTFSQRAGTIMHELGHTLGLRHGGVDNINYKPNHLSVMSYWHQMDWLTRNGAPWLDFDRFSLADLNEASLNEQTGLDATAGETALSIYGVRWFGKGIARSKSSQANIFVDWNANGISSDASVSSDLNRNGVLETLRGGHIEWSNIIYNGGEIGVGGIASMLADPATDLKEMTEEDLLLIRNATQRR